MRYDFTAQENIGLGNVAHIEDTARVRQAADKAGVNHAIESLPHGYQTMLSRMFAQDGNGVDLSGGEWQKIAIARMFMRDADLFILDEPTAALDAQAESELYGRFVDLVAGRTSLVISHRFSTVRMADMVVVLENGHITELGTHEELMALGNRYANLYRMQAERYTLPSR
jgi:ATP-binding cassette subfamily B protein